MAFPIRYQGQVSGLREVVVARVGRRHDSGPPRLDHELRLATSVEGVEESEGPMLVLPRVDADVLQAGDVVAVHPNGFMELLFRAGSLDNALFVTDRCSSNCLMCSQPPRDRDDIAHHLAINERLIPLIPKTTPILGMTGGEPTLLGRHLLRLLRKLGAELPDTELQILSNGRAFAWHAAAAAVSEAITSPAILCIPLYSDHAREHDYIVQARDAFSQTVLGLHNLAKAGVRVEVRVVLHRLTTPRLPALVRFIHRNLPFVEHVALMGLEYTGYTPCNSRVLWIDPPTYEPQLREAVEYLTAFRMNVSLYNLPLCLLPADLWGFARSSISDWKRDFHRECVECDVRSECGGLFATSGRHSENIRAIRRR